MSEMFTRISKVPDQSWKMDEEYTRRRDEVGQMATAFQSMMDRLHASNSQLIQAKAFNESIVENIPMGVVVYTQGREQVFRNRKAERMLQEETEWNENGETLGHILRDMVAKDEVLPVSVQMKDREGRTHNYELGAWRLTGKDRETLGTLYTIDDVTYQRHMEEKANQDEKLAYTG